MSQEPNLADATTYANCMNEVRQRINAVKDLAADIRSGQGEDVFMTELVFLQLRKTLELIAFGSLTAHREKYVEAYKNASIHWNAKAILESVEKLNPKFYPTALIEAVELRNGVKNLTPMTDGFITRTEFVQLYNVCSELLHARNPFSEKPLVTNIGHTVGEWVRRIENLLRHHSVFLVNGGLWLTVIPKDGPVKVFPAAERVPE